MKNVNVLAALILVSAIGFSQAPGNPRIGQELLDVPISDVVIIKEAAPLKPMLNTEKNPLIDQINRLELAYVALKAREVQTTFINQALPKTKEAAYNEYIAFLKKRISEEEEKLTKREIPLSNGSDYGIVHREETRKIENKNNHKATINISRANKKGQ